MVAVAGLMAIPAFVAAVLELVRSSFLDLVEQLDEALRDSVVNKVVVHGAKLLPNPLLGLTIEGRCFEWSLISCCPVAIIYLSQTHDRISPDRNEQSSNWFRNRDLSRSDWEQPKQQLLMDAYTCVSD